MRAYAFQESVLLETFAGPADRILPEHALRGLRVRITPGWWEQARCLGTDTDAWFPRSGAKVNRLVERVCTGCPVRKSCLAAAVLDDEYGIWGGTRRGQRLHARARMLNDDPAGDVLGDLLHTSMPATEYAVPDPDHPTPPVALPAPAETAGPDDWREAS